MFSSFSKKSIFLSTAIVLSFGLVGCGSGSGSATSSDTTADTATSSDTATPVKGPVYSATVKDANGQVAVELKDVNGTLLPKYKFANTPVYPVTVTGGWADQDYNGIMELDKGDILLKNPMKTFDITKPITPITTEAAKDSTTEKDFKNNLKNIANQYSDATGIACSVDDLEKTGTDAKPAIIALNVGLYPEISSKKKVDYLNLYNNVIANMNINANTSSNANISVVKEIECQIFHNSNRSKPEYSSDDISFYKKLYKIPVYVSEKADIVAIYNNIGHDWENIAHNDYADAKVYRSNKAFNCADFTGSNCTEETRANGSVNVTNIVFLQANQNTSATNANTSSVQNSNHEEHSSNKEHR